MKLAPTSMYTPGDDKHWKFNVQYQFSYIVPDLGDLQTRSLDPEIITEGQPNLRITYKHVGWVNFAIP